MDWQRQLAEVTTGAIVHFDTGGPLPGPLDFKGREALLLIAWQGDRPLAMLFCDRKNGPSVPLPEWIAGLEPAERETDPALLPLPPEGRPSLTVAVCTRDRPRLLAACLGSIRRQTLPPAEVLVVDNAPRNDSARQVTARHPGCRYVGEERPGIARARNRAIQEARGEVVAFVDDDCFLVPNWTRRLAAWFARRPGLGCVTGPVLPLALETRGQELIERRGGYARGFATRIFTRDSGPALSRDYPVQAWLFGTGASMAFSRERLLAIGGFDETVHAEDLDVFYRVLTAGSDLVYEPGAAVLHRHPRELAAVRRNFRAWGRGYVQFLCNVAASISGDRPKAHRELWSWLFRYQCRALMRGKMAGRDYPRSMIVQEILGGMGALAQSLVKVFRPKIEG